VDLPPAPDRATRTCARRPVTAHSGNGSGRPVPRPNFGDRLTEAVAARESQIVLGIDPDPAKLWPAAVEATSEARAALAGAGDEEFFKDWTLRNGDQVLFTMPKIAVLRSFVLNHIIHHRAQLTVYLRLNDIPVPGLYGPSADESNF